MAELRHPRVDLFERPRLDGIQPPLTVGPHGREAGVAEHLEVLGDRGVRDAELHADDLGQLTRGPLAVGEQGQQAAPDGVTEDVEGVHPAIVAHTLN